MKNISPQKSNSLIIDICKFIGAYMVVATHTTSLNLFGTGALNAVYVNFIYLLRRTMFLYGVGLSDCKSNGVAVYGK